MNRPKLTITRRQGPKLSPPAEPTQASPRVVVPPSTVCERCGVYVIYPEVHDDWHSRQAARARRWDHIRDLVLRVFLARGYITTDEKTTPTNGGTP
ncbi:hypothetical protein [Nocardia nova]|uniref:hypothetical protein n=1 Tax=Nocardia nova TaxID=37330 RepID=UPI0018930C2B|nr:hypothetical protein [Nocardia nova]MBF6277014.1 hypothetical protein [Nocardia nova]